MKQGNFPATPEETGNVLIHLLSKPRSSAQCWMSLQPHSKHFLRPWACQQCEQRRAGKQRIKGNGAVPCCSTDEGYGRGRAKLGKQRVHVDCEGIHTGNSKLLKVVRVPLHKRSPTPPEHYSRGLSRDWQLCPEHIPRLCTALWTWNHGSKSSCGTGKAHSP